jgi:PAS domain S-box-containing protein
VHTSPTPLLRHLQRFSDQVTMLPVSARYAIAVLSAAAGVLLRAALNSVWGDRVPFITLFPAVMLSAWLGGFWPGIVCTAISAAAAAFMWMSPDWSWTVRDPREWLALLVFVALSAVISALNESWRRSARALATSERHLAVTLGSIGDAVLTTDNQARVTHLNAVAETLTGWTAAEALGRPLEDVFVILDEHGQPPPTNPVRRALQDGVVTGLEEVTLLRSRDGQTRPIDDSAAPIRTADGSTLGAVMVFRDVTERLRVDREREAQARALRELAAIVQSSDDAIISKDLDSTVRSWNRGAERMFGYSSEEMVGTSIRVIIPEERWSEEDDVLGQLRRGDTVDHFETVRRRKDGSLVPVSLTISPIHGSDGSVIGASKIARDISQRQRAEAERAESLRREQAARAETDRASRLKDDFLAVLSHELRTPLNAVLGYGQLLATGALSAEQTQHAVLAIQRNAKAQAELIESLLDMSRVLAGKLELTLAQTSLPDVVGAAVDALRPEAAAKGIALELRVPPAPIVVTADAARLQQVFGNLLSNAIKFTPAPGRVTLDFDASATEAQVRIADTGHGIPANLLPRIFDRFTQGDGEDARARGLGLGLSLVRDLVAAHGGTVTAESGGRGLGSTFTVRLPIGDAMRQSTSGLGDRLIPRDAVLGASPFEVLLVDDEQDARDMAMLMLGMKGARVRTAASAAEAIDLMHQRRPDVLLADIGMPGEDGYSLIRTWREVERTARSVRVPAIAVTAYASPRDRDMAAAAGFDWHIAKPIDLDELTRAIAAAIAQEQP